MLHMYTFISIYNQHEQCTVADRVPQLCSIARKFYRSHAKALAVEVMQGSGLPLCHACLPQLLSDLHHHVAG